MGKVRRLSNQLRTGCIPALVCSVWLLAAAVSPAAEPQRLTDDGRLKTDPVYVPQSEAISYAVLESPTLLALMRLDLAAGTSTRMHQDAKASEFELAWSRDGRHYAYVQSRGNLNLKLVIHDTQEKKDTTYDPGGGFSGMHSPTFSTDGTRVLFSIPAAGGQQIASCNLAGQDRQTLTQTPGLSNWPGYSPDGQRIVFGSSRDGDFEIYTTLPNGSDARRLTTSPGRDCRPSYSPDGRQIAFTSTRNGNPEIYVMDTDGTRPRNVTQHAESDDYAAWHPDGRHVVAVSQREGRYDLYLWDVPE